MATNPPVSATAASGGDNDDKRRVIMLGIIGAICLLIVLMLSYAFWSEMNLLNAANSALTGKLEAANTKIGELGKRKPTEIISGLTSEQCTALATDIVGKSCVGKTSTKIVPKWRDRPQQAYAPQASRPSRALRDYAEQRGSVKALDRCIFRVKGEIKAETEVENGQVNCPIWRDAQMARFNQKPADLLWERKYSTVK